nr:glycosyltransferase family 4 protein [Rhodoplanes tepidamans]
MKVLSIAHPAVSRDVGRRRYYPFATRDDLDVHLVVPATWHQFGRTMTADPPPDPGVTLHVMPIRLKQAGPMSWYLHFYPGLRKLIRTLSPDVIHLWEEPWSVVALQAALLKGPAALVLEVDQNILKTLPPPFESIRRHVLKQTAHLLSRSPDATMVCRARGYAGPVSPIGYGVDRDTFRPDPAAAPPRRAASAEQPLRLGYVGRIVVEKGLDDALDAMARTQAPVTLSILGEGPYLPRLRERIATLGLGDRVDIRGWASPAEVASFIRGLDALILLTRTTDAVREQFGRVIVEAQSCGVPVIGSTCGAIPDVIGAGGWIVPESDPVALAALVETLAADPQTRTRKGEDGQRNVLARFTYEAVAKALSGAWAAAARETKSREKLDKNGSSSETKVSPSLVGND